MRDAKSQPIATRASKVKPSRTRDFAAIILGSVLATTPALAQKKYDPGATDSEVKIGSITSNAGRASEYGAVAGYERAQALVAVWWRFDACRGDKTARAS
jgi:hypothetical protein